MRKITTLLLICIFLYTSVAYSFSIDNAYKRYLLGDYQGAIDEALKLRQNDQVLYFLGLAYIKLGDYTNARVYLSKLLKRFPDSQFYEEGLLKFADTYFLYKNYTTAKDLYEKILKKHPTFNFLPTVYLRLAQIASKEGEWDDKKKYLQKIRIRFPKSPEIQLVEVLENYGDYFTIQVGAFSKQKNALSLREELEDKYPTYVVHDKRGSLDIYKVKVGKYRERTEADSVYQQLRKQGYPARIYP